MLGKVFALIPTFPQYCKIFQLIEKQQKIWGTD